MIDLRRVGKLYCPKCQEYKNNYMFANPYNSTKFCVDCGVALNMKEYEELEKSEDLEKSENPYAFIDVAITNAITKMFIKE